MDYQNLFNEQYINQQHYEKIKRTLQELQEKVKAKKETCEIER